MKSYVVEISGRWYVTMPDEAPAGSNAGGVEVADEETAHRVCDGLNRYLARTRPEPSREAFAQLVHDRLVAALGVSEKADKPYSIEQLIDLVRVNTMHAQTFLAQPVSARVESTEPPVKMRLRSLLHANGRETEAGVTLEGTGNLLDWLIVTVPEHTDDRTLRKFRIAMHERFGPKVAVFVQGVEFFVFERVKEE